MQVAPFLECSDQVEVLLGVPLLKRLIELYVIRVNLEVGAQWDCLCDKLLGKHGDILREPACQWVLVHVLMCTQHYNELVRLDRAMTQTYWHEYCLSVLMDQCKERLQISNESCET